MSDARRPAPRVWLIGLLGLTIGIAAAASLALWGPRPGALAVELPQWLAERLSTTGQREAVITRPETLWLLPATVLPFLVLMSRRSLVDVPRWQIGLQLLARLAVIAAVSLALAQPTLESPIRGKTVVFVVDTSESIDEGQLSAAQALVAEGLQQIADEDEADLPRPDRTRLALVSYASRSHVHKPTTQAELADALLRVEGEGLASDHAGAVRLAAAMVDPQTEGRVVLLTDGAGSLAEREDLAAAARELAARGITLHTRSFPATARGEPSAGATRVDDVRLTGDHCPMTRTIIALAAALVVAVTGSVAQTQVLCDVDRDDRVTDVDVVHVLLFTAELPSGCTLATCDADADGVITDLDGVEVLRAAALLPSACPVPVPSPGPSPFPSDGIVLSPSNVMLTVGESRFYTAIAPGEDGSPVNVTQEVNYVSSDPAVAQAPNLPGTKSEIIAVGPGTATISAEDPMTGLSSNPGGNATVLVLGALESITVSPENTTLLVGESRFYTAIGNFAGGDTLNLTQEVDYSSSNETVAIAPNEQGLRSQVTAVGPGTTTVTARDPETGTVSNAASLMVLGALQSITLAPDSASRPIGVAIFYTANGNFEGGFTLNLTQEVEYTSSNDLVAVAQNEPGLKSRIDPVGAGETMITARDPDTGVTSAAALLTVF